MTKKKINILDHVDRNILWLFKHGIQQEHTYNSKMLKDQAIKPFGFVANEDFL